MGITSLPYLNGWDQLVIYKTGWFGIVSEKYMQHMYRNRIFDRQQIFNWLMLILSVLLLAEA